MIPKSLKEPKWLLPMAIIGFCLGVFLFTVYFLPGFAPHMRENMIQGGIIHFIPLVAGMSILSPVALLWWCVKMDQKEE